MKKIITGVLFKGQPLFEEWSEDRNTIIWSSRKVSGKYPTEWRMEGYIELARVRFNNRLRPDTKLAEAQRARLELMRMEGMEIDKAHYKRLAATLAHPQPGDRISDAHGEMRCMACVDGYVMARRKGCVPFVMPEDQWHLQPLLDKARLQKMFHGEHVS
jgi:hypothetical protein